MPDFELDPTFEARLERRLRGFGDEAVRPFDAAEIARVAASSAKPGWRSHLPALSKGWRPVLVLVLLAVTLVGVGIVGGFIKLPTNNLFPNPSLLPSLPPPTAPASPGGPTASPDGSAVPSSGTSFVPPSEVPTASPTPTLTASPGPTSEPTPEPTSEPTVPPTATPTITPTPSPTPELVGGVAAIAQGDTHSCALADDGRVFCWGQNDEGQLGDGTTDYREYGTVPVVGIDDARAIAAGIRFSCAALADGSVWCWGEDPGQGPSTLVPRKVAGIADARAVAAGGNFACALRQTGQVACWGNNALGQLGIGTFSPGEEAAQQVSGLDDVVELTAGWNHACVVRTDGSVWCWGGNGDGATGYGQLGDGTFSNRSTPVEVAGLANIVEVSAGGWSTCARAADGEIWCWGYGERGTLGDGNSANSNVPVQPGISDGRLVAVGRFQACVRRADQSVWCWGDTSWGSSTGGPATTPVEGSKTRPTTVSALAVGRYVLLLDNSGRVWSWGVGTNQTPERWPVGP